MRAIYKPQIEQKMEEKEKQNNNSGLLSMKDFSVLMKKQTKQTNKLK